MGCAKVLWGATRHVTSFPRLGWHVEALRRGPRLRSLDWGSLASWPCPLQPHLSSPAGQGRPWSLAGSDQNTWVVVALGTSLAVAARRLVIQAHLWPESLSSPPGAISQSRASAPAHPSIAGLTAWDPAPRSPSVSKGSTVPGVGGGLVLGPT